MIMVNIYVVHILQVGTSPLEPHVYAVAGVADHRRSCGLGLTNQAIVVSGESGAGKVGLGNKHIHACEYIVFPYAHTSIDLFIFSNKIYGWKSQPRYIDYAVLVFLLETIYLVIQLPIYFREMCCVERQVLDYFLRLLLARYIIALIVFSENHNFQVQ